jgi:4-coumarate--CoA ligase
VIPSQLETILKSHPGVEDAAVVGIKSEDYGELPMAYAKKKPGYDKLEAKKLINFLHSNKLSYVKFKLISLLYSIQSPL